MTSDILKLFGIRYPIIQGGMIWCAGHELVTAVSQAGGLGLLGAGSMHPPVLRAHIQKVKASTDQPFGVNVPLLYPEPGEVMKIILEEDVKIVFTSAGNPGTFTSILKDRGAVVVHVVSSAKFAIKAEQAGVDAIVAEGFEAGGHNGREETTTMCLIPTVRQVTGLPLIAAGGIGSGSAIVAAMALGADGVQIGSLFAASQESSAHQLFKQKIIEAKEGDTLLMLKELAPVRLLRNPFFDLVKKAYSEGASVDQLKELLGRGRAKKGMFEGNSVEGELEIGQVSASISTIKTVDKIMTELIVDYNIALEKLQQNGSMSRNFE